MKAAIIKDYGQAVKISEVDKPLLDDKSVMIEVHAASVNPIDNLVRAGYMKDMMPIAFPYVMGYDVSGRVVEVGKDVKTIKVGDEVYARPNQNQAGSLSEYNVVLEEEVALKPKNISHSQAASLPLAGLTAMQALTSKGKLQAGQRVLIHAGSGGVGTLAIQMAKHLGAHVAVTTSQANFQLVKDLGADVLIDYKSEAFEERLEDYDLVLDTMGGEILNKSFKVLKKGGHLVSIKGQDSQGLADQYGVNFQAFFMWPSGQMLSEISRMVADETLRPVVDRQYDFKDVQKAYDYLQEGHAKGKVVVNIK